jgi:hypothetical protein
MRCDASFRCAKGAIAAWQFDDHIPLRLRCFEIFSGTSGDKVGQCAVTVGQKLSVFIDGLQLLPEYRALWTPAMAALLDELGSGRYRYGSQWSIEPPREQRLLGLQEIVIEVIQKITVQAVDFTRWGSWDEYFRQISANARRNAKRASAQNPTLCVRVRRGISTLIDTADLTRLQHVMASRKNLGKSRWNNIARFIFRTVAMQKYTITALVMVGGHAMAAYSGIEFGQNTYYLTGGSEANSGGAAWHLMLTMIRQAYDRTQGSGKFLMGSDQEGAQGWANLAWSREQCRVTNFPTSIVTFMYHKPFTRA